jgi:predicted dehydrogenase
MKTVVVLGAGQLGSRHLQALKSVPFPLSIHVVDPSRDSLALSKSRFSEAPGYAHHTVTYSHSKPKEHINFAIIATTADVRFSVTKELISSTKVDAILFEKILFCEPEDYSLARELLSNTKAWVNCCMRQLEIYKKIKATLKGRIDCFVSASKFGLITNSIHYVDFLAYLTGSNDFTVDCSLLDSEFIPSKRKGFSECTGTLRVAFGDGSTGTFSNYLDGDSPIVVQFSSGNARFIVRETEGVALYSGMDNGWKWETIEGEITPQSVLTTQLAIDVLTTGDCVLTPLEESSIIHSRLFEPIRYYFGLSRYPFT